MPLPQLIKSNLASAAKMSSLPPHALRGADEDRDAGFFERLGQARHQADGAARRRASRPL